MMPTTMEPIEGTTLLLAVLALLVSLGLLWRSWTTYRAAVRSGSCAAVLVLGWGRVVNEMFRSGISAGVTYAAWVNAWAPMPPAPTFNRSIFQAIWLGIAFACFAQSVINERNARRVVTIIERERAAGRMAETDAHAAGRAQGNAEGRRAQHTQEAPE